MAKHHYVNLTKQGDMDKYLIVKESMQQRYNNQLLIT
jgi:hypothetical protein